MPIRRRIVFVLSAALLTLISVFIVSSYIFLSSSFKQLEEDNVIKEIERTLLLIDREAENLNLITRDWASWDDTYYFMTDKSARYIENNLMVDTLTNLDVNFMVFIGLDGDIEYSRAVDLLTEQEISLPQELINILTTSNLLFVNPGDLGVSGITSLDGCPVILSACPILTSKDEGPVNGTLVFARVIDESVTENFSNILQFPIIFHSYSDDKLPAIVTDSADTRAKIIRTPSDPNQIAGYTVLYDIYGNPSFVIEIDLDRNIYAQGKTTFYYYLVAVIIIGLIFIMVVGLAVDRFIVKRVNMINENVIKLGNNGKSSMRYKTNKKDELTLLIAEINNMLIRMEQSSQETVNKEKFYSTLVEKNNDGIIVIDGGKIKFSNSRMAEMIGYAQDELVDKYYTDFVAEEYNGFVENDYRIRIAGREVPDKYEIVMLSKDNNKLQVEVSLRNVNLDNKPVVIAVVRDITNRKLIEESLIAADRLVSVHKQIANVIPEINGYLTNIAEYTSSFQGNKLPGEIRKDMEIANSEAKNALKKLEKIWPSLIRHASV